MQYNKKTLDNHREFFVRLIGLEPTRRETPDPKSGASTNFATGAKCVPKAVHALNLLQR